MTGWEKELTLGGVGIGWKELLDELKDGLEILCTDGNDIEIQQIKEKFGGLRVYFSSSEDIYEQAGDLVRRAERAAWKTCEVCGQDGKSRPGGWIKTLCDDCVAAR